MYKSERIPCSPTLSLKTNSHHGPLNYLHVFPQYSRPFPLEKLLRLEMRIILQSLRFYFRQTFSIFCFYFAHFHCQHEHLSSEFINNQCPLIHLHLKFVLYFIHAFSDYFFPVPMVQHNSNNWIPF